VVARQVIGVDIDLQSLELAQENADDLEVYHYFDSKISAFAFPSVWNTESFTLFTPLDFTFQCFMACIIDELYITA
jgi:methylase of polypeptide subunit release factors